MLVFRDGRQTVNGPRLLAQLADALLRLSSISTPIASLVIDALLRAGELECALADVGDPAARPLAETTDAVAAALLDSHTLQIVRLESTVRDFAIPEKQMQGLKPCPYAMSTGTTKVVP